MEPFEKKKPPKARRNGFVINTPFLTDKVKIVNINELTDEQQALERTNNDFSYLKQPAWEKYFDFVYCQYPKNRVFNDPTTEMQVIGERAFFKDYQTACDFFKEFFKHHDWIRYVCFQYEQGATGNLHLQGYIQYTKPMHYKTVRKQIMPTMSLRPAGDSALESINYYNKIVATGNHTNRN